jgi:glucose-6-phosphate-specific signal transduction histidine kinase
MSDFNSNFVNILISGIDTVKWVDVADIKKITVYRILQELLINMKNIASSLVILSFKSYDNTIYIEYTDNGKGATIEKLNSKNGLSGKTVS